ncbi:MAG: TetR/AcrR family transcriptional regulator [Oscillospiraceae bacterium]|nr:TetR/AcrR family transcriptional regulator [Oscillospiraceae bacterium]
MARRRVNTTKYEIIQTATTLFLEKGYSATAPKLICDTLDISTGNLTYYFPTKEHLLAVLVEMLCRFQEQTMQSMVEDEGKTSLLAVCLELSTMSAMCEDSEIAKDLFVSAYSSPITLEIIRKNDTLRSMQIYKEFCPDWTEHQYIEAEILVSGIEYATLMTTDYSVPIELRITGALDNIMKIFNVPEEVRQQKIRKVLSIDYRALGRTILDQFRQFVNDTNEHTFETLLGNANN